MPSMSDDDFERLIARLDETDTNLELRIQKLEIILNGDAAERARWEAGKLNYPRMAEPPPGLVDQFQSYRTSTSAWSQVLQDKVERALAGLNAKTAFATKLEAFFGPLIANKNPPLDGAEIATKEFVDRAIDRIAGALRDELRKAIEMPALFMRDALVQMTNWDHRKSSDTGIAIANATTRLGNMYKDFVARQRADWERRTRPSRWQLLVGFLTGRPPAVAAPGDA